MVSPCADVELHGVRLDCAIAPREVLRDHRMWLRAIERDVERVVVVEDPHDRWIAGRCTILRDALREAHGRLRELPDGVIDRSVERGRMGRSNRPNVA